MTEIAVLIVFAFFVAIAALRITQLRQEAIASPATSEGQV